MKKILVVALLALSLPAFAENYDPYKVGVVGVSMFLGSIALANDNVPWNKATELQGWSFCWTTMGFKFLPKDFNFMSPIFVGAFDLMWRIPQIKGNEDMALRKLACDLSGVLGACLVEIDFGKDVKAEVSPNAAQVTLKF